MSSNLTHTVRPGAGDHRPKPIRYGLPCRNCRLYYAAELAACPICKCDERISTVREFVPARPQF
jgi:hypothetical protein